MKWTLPLLTGLLMLTSLGCKKNEFSDVDGLPPEIKLEAEHIATEPGREFTIKGIIADNDGIKSINLQNADLELNKTIDLTLDSTVYSYTLNYRFKTREDLAGESFDMNITVTDLGGRTSSAILKVTMDGDFNAPEFKIVPDEAITVLLKATTRLNVKFRVEDNKALQKVEIAIPEIAYSREITSFTSSGRILEFAEQITLPSSLASYSLRIKASDKSGLETEKQSNITVSEMPDFPKMYLVDVANAALLNSDIFGVPMLIEHTGAYTYRARYYSAAAGTEIRFIPQKTDFAPICFGSDPLNAQLLTDDPDVSQALKLPGRGYYEIAFNVKTGVYSVKSYTPAEAPVAIGSDMLLDATRPAEGSIPLRIGLVGSGVPNAGNWNTAQPLILQQDSGNKYLFSVEMNLQAGATIGFIIQTQHSWGWWPEPFWRWDRGEDPEINVANGGQNPGNWTIKTSGKYLFKFDSHLKRSQFYPIN